MSFSIAGKRVLVTGGASGIGKLMIGKLLDRGAALVVVWDIDKAGMERLKTDFSSYASKLVTITVDLNNPESISEAINNTLAVSASIHLLINNAGIVVGKFFHEHSLQEIQRTLQINTAALMQTTHGFLPGMMTDNQGAICNISSLASLISNPRMSVYCSSKWAVTGWSDSLRLEMMQLGKNISVTTILPYYISTGMFEGVRSPLIPLITPDKAAEKIIRGIELQRKMVTMPLPYWFIRLAQGILPISLFDWVMENVFGIYSSMKDFKGRSQALK